MNKVYLTLFILFWLFIAVVGSIDTSLTVQYQDGLKQHEENPVARLILSSDDWQVSRFVGMKMFSTILVLGILVVLYVRDIKYGLLITTVLAVFQGLLLSYLLLS